YSTLVPPPPSTYTLSLHDALPISEMPLDTILDLVFLPIWIILVPVSACCRWWVSATEWNSPVESSPSSTQLGYFQVIAEPVSTCAHTTLLRAPRHSARLVTKL